MEEDLDLIHRFIRGECNDDEIRDFNSRLESDAEFRQNYEQEKAILQSLGLHERERLKDLLKEEEGNKSNFKWYAVAALFPLFIAVYFIFLSGPSPDQLYDSYYETYGVYEYGQERGDSSIDGLEVTAFDMYKSGDYDLALKQFEELYALNAEPGILLYQGICLMEMNKYSNAIDKFSGIGKDSKYYQISNWYKALAHLKTGNIEKGKELLMGLVNEKNGLGKRAGQLLEEL